MSPPELRRSSTRRRRARCKRNVNCDWRQTLRTAESRTKQSERSRKQGGEEDGGMENNTPELVPDALRLHPLN